MKTRKTFFTLLAILIAMIMLVSACAPAAAPAPAQEAPPAQRDGGWVIGFSNFSLANAWRVQMVAEFEYASSRLIEQGVISEVIMTHADNDISQQISDLRDLIVMGVDAIVVTAASPTALIPVFEEAIDAGIVVVCFDQVTEFFDIASNVRMSDFEYGAIGGRWLVDQLGGVGQAQGDIIILNGLAGTMGSAQRYAGAMFYLGREPGINVLGDAHANWAYAPAKIAMEAFLAAHPNIDGIWSSGGAMTQAAIDAFNEAGRPLVPMVGGNNNGFLKAWIENAPYGFTSIAPSYEPRIVNLALDTAIRALRGESVDRQITIDIPVITEDNKHEFVRWDLPDSFFVASDLSEEKIVELFRD